MVPLILPQTPQKHCDLWKGTVRRRAVDAWEPALPLILAAWHDTPAMLKMVRLAEHIQWAEKHIRVAIGHAQSPPHHRAQNGKRDALSASSRNCGVSPQ